MGGGASGVGVSAVVAVSDFGTAEFVAPGRGFGCGVLGPATVTAGTASPGAAVAAEPASPSVVVAMASLAIGLVDAMSVPLGVCS